MGSLRSRVTGQEKPNRRARRGGRATPAIDRPTRRAILARLASGQATVSELVEPFTMTAPAVTKHLKVLKRAGLIDQGREKQWRPCRLQPQPLKDAADWVETCRQLWELRLDRREDYLRELRTNCTPPMARKPPTSTLPNSAGANPAAWKWGPWARTS